ncbi:Uncharacterised protein [Streptococcus pseudoporcinus]|nr:Uncharacterised protein [Streptococcus pseudoporcinus]
MIVFSTIKKEIYIDNFDISQKLEKSENYSDYLSDDFLINSDDETFIKELTQYYFERQPNPYEINTIKKDWPLPIGNLSISLTNKQS